ncbi:enoyl-CoA hydratase family protein [Janibacter alkaliphilus]|uniref:Enoyl-CoA hydratase n=1 Tax=Janibacter alkaliphilus TaxID=1069963 RepID=A0A852X4E5_9MICO|nr:enoyl-CoA hydratase family protein [Janibacter alkaliphilus]NYG37769.1 enoyl-CoA hydratase [Janibacter alkaliphilus]
MSSDPRVRSAVDGQVAVLTLDSPHNRNALSDQLVRELHAGLQAAAEDDAVRCVVLTHTGGTFCAGADLSEATGGEGGDPARARADQLVDLLRAIVVHPKPVVGRIDGHVVAGGMGLVAACDLVVAGPSSSFALTEVRLGLAASVISLTVLPRIGSREASRYLLTAERLDPAQARNCGLVTVAAESEQQVADEVAALTEAFAGASPQGLRETKTMLNHELVDHLDTHRDRVAEQSSRLFSSDEAREGMTAFLERRPPRWAR